jgi:hypothetical protein
MPGFVVRKDNGDLRWYPLFQVGSNYTFYPPDDVKTGEKVGDNWDFQKYLSGYWDPGHASSFRRRIGGGSGRVVLEEDGDLRYFPFRDGTFFVDDTGRRVGRGFLAEWDYYVAEWTDNGTSDLIVRDDEGKLRLYPWNGREFDDIGRSKFIGEGFEKEEYPDLLPGYWRGQNFPDLISRRENGDLHLYPFNGRTFRDQGRPDRVGRGFDDDYTHFMAEEWTGNGTTDLLVRKKNKDVVLYQFGPLDPDKDHNVFADPPYPIAGRGFRDDWHYLPGFWREDGRPDLMVCDDDDNVRFYPFEETEFLDLEKDLKRVGRRWRFTHYWDFYPH